MLRQRCLRNRLEYGSWVQRRFRATQLRGYIVEGTASSVPKAREPRFAPDKYISVFVSIGSRDTICVVMKNAVPLRELLARLKERCGFVAHAGATLRISGRKNGPPLSFTSQDPAIGTVDFPLNLTLSNLGITADSVLTFGVRAPGGARTRSSVPAAASPSPDPQTVQPAPESEDASIVTTYRRAPAPAPALPTASTSATTLDVQGVSPSGTSPPSPLPPAPVRRAELTDYCPWPCCRNKPKRGKISQKEIKKHKRKCALNPKFDMDGLLGSSDAYASSAGAESSPGRSEASDLDTDVEERQPRQLRPSEEMPPSSDFAVWPDIGQMVAGQRGVELCTNRSEDGFADAEGSQGEVEMAGLMDEDFGGMDANPYEGVEHEPFVGVEARVPSSVTDSGSGEPEVELLNGDLEEENLFLLNYPVASPDIAFVDLRPISPARECDSDTDEDSAYVESNDSADSDSEVELLEDFGEEDVEPLPKAKSWVLAQSASTREDDPSHPAPLSEIEQGIKTRLGNNVYHYPPPPPTSEVNLRLLSNRYWGKRLSPLYATRARTSGDSPTPPPVPKREYKIEKEEAGEEDDIRESRGDGNGGVPGGNNGGGGNAPVGPGGINGRQEGDDGDEDGEDRREGDEGGADDPGVDGAGAGGADGGGGGDGGGGPPDGGGPAGGPAGGPGAGGHGLMPGGAGVVGDQPLPLPHDFPPPDDIGPPPDFEPAIVELDEDQKFALAFYQAWRGTGGTEQSWADYKKVMDDTPLLVELPTLHIAKGLVTTITGHIGQRIPRCPTGCISYGCARYADLEECPRCLVPRRRPDRRPMVIPEGEPRVADHGESSWLYTGFIEALQAPFADPANATRLRHRHTAAARYFAARQRARHPDHQDDNVAIRADDEYDMLSDLTCGRTYWELQDQGIFEDERDGMLAFSWDGADLVRDKNSGCWFVFVINWSLPPQERHLKKWLICAAVIPGSPWDIESFLEPLHLDRIRLENGVHTWDASTRQWFIYKAYFVALLADLPARAKAACTVGHTGACGCMKCKVQGVTSQEGGGTYYPAFVTPAGYERREYGYDDSEPDLFPELRNHDGYLLDVEEVMAANPGAPYEAARLRTGITSRSAWQGAACFLFPSFYVMDIMHLFWANIAPLFFQLILGKVPGWENADWVVDDDAKIRIHDDILKLGIDLPSRFGNRPRGTNKLGKWKCKEHSNFTLLYSVEILRPHVSEAIILMWMKFVEVAELCSRSSITRLEVEDVRVKSREFVVAWDVIFYGNEERERAALSRMCVHYMLHLAEQILDWGPLIGYSQYTPERIIGQLKACIRSKTLYQENLQVQVLHRQNDNILAAKLRTHVQVRRAPASQAISLQGGAWTLRHKRSSDAIRLTPLERQAYWTLTGRPGELELDENFGGHRWARATGPGKALLTSHWIEASKPDATLRRANKCEITVPGGQNLYIGITSFHQLYDEGAVRLVVFGFPHSRIEGTLPGIKGTYRPMGQGAGSVLGCWDIESIGRQIVTFPAERDAWDVVFIAAKSLGLQALEEGGV
ncbi:hypothetical protein P7C70_g7562, partial [Phenoliferia sp. Uapishka_3]